MKNLDLSVLKNKKFKTISSKEALLDVVPYFDDKKLTEIKLSEVNIKRKVNDLL